MLARQLFNKALYLLDRGAIEAAEQTLRAALEQAALERDDYDEAEISRCLGELLVERDRAAEARPYLETFVKSDLAHSMQKERKAVEELLQRINNAV
jgi:hypothetical protein